jgi:DNA-binding transcriptional ArsR family regulator
VSEPNAVFQALADPTRRAVLRTLSESGPTTLSDLSRRLPISRQAVTKHLALLQDAGLVVGHGEVRGRRYELTPGPLVEAMGWIAGGWDDRLARLKRHVETHRDGRSRTARGVTSSDARSARRR